MTVLEAARTHMIESQLRPNKVMHEGLLDAFARVRRELFVPKALQPVAYVDEDLPLGGGRYLMEPMVAGRLIQALAPARNGSALVIGGGYEAALLGVMMRAVTALEEDAELGRAAHAALVDEGIATVTVVEGPLTAGCRQRAPYQVILFGGAVAAVPEAIVGQLADGGRIAAVVNGDDAAIGRATLITRTSGIIARRVIFDAATRLLPGFAPQPAFVF